MKIGTLSIVFMTLASAATFACSSDGTSTSPDSGAAVTAGDSQTPPTNPDDTKISAWLSAGSYKSWKCEAAAHDARSPSPHMKNRICSNDKLSAHTAGEYPIGAASVKELYDAAGTNIVGYAIGLKVAQGGGDAWYWFEKTSTGVVANGLGTSGTPKTVCVGCHAGAGSDANHSGHDQVYTQVK